MCGMEKDACRAVKFSGKQKDYYCWSQLFLSYAEIRKYRDVLLREIPVPDLEDAAVKAENDPQAKAKHADTLFRLQKAKSELLTVVEKISLCFLGVSCAKNAREAWLSLKASRLNISSKNIVLHYHILRDSCFQNITSK